MSKNFLVANWSGQHFPWSIWLIDQSMFAIHADGGA
jgi:hypothetical protein